MRPSAYRTNASELYDEGRVAEERELEAIAVAARRQRRRGVLLAATLGVTLLVAPLALFAARPGPPQVLHCHRVTIQYENAMYLPPDTYTRCEWR